MAVMTVDIPDGMTAQIILGPADALGRRTPLEIPYETVEPAPTPKRRRRWFLSSVGALALLVTGFLVGAGLRPHHEAHAETAAMAPSDYVPPAINPGPPPATTAFPLQAPPAPPAPPQQAASAAPANSPPSDQVPPDFTASLQAKPQIQAAPGQPPAQGGAPAKPQNAFGLGD